MRIKNGLSKMVILALIPAVMSVLVSCSSQMPDTAYSPRQIAEVMRETQEGTAALHLLLPDDDYFGHYVSEIYEMNLNDVSDGVIFYTAGMLADEIAVFEIADDADILETENALKDYIDRRISAFTGYAPDQAAILSDGKVVLQGNHIALIILQDSGSALSAFNACFSNSPPAVPDRNIWLQREMPEDTPEPFEPLPSVIEITPEPEATEREQEDTQIDAPETEPDASGAEYDPDAILRAWRSGDYSVLTDFNREILLACISVIGEVTDDSMTDLEKELAVHNWIILTADYDTEANSNSPNARPDPNNGNPYGLLINGKAICTGYTLTFQLFMDMLGIECITVHGHAITGGEHAWNMVVIDGEWYCVDVTWNDPTRQSGRGLTDVNFKYFNVPTQVLLDAGHQWDFDSTPVATAPQLLIDN